MNPRRRLLLAAPAIAFAAPRIAASQPSSSRPLRLLVPYAPGGPTDILARLLAAPLSDRLGYPVVVENVPGAGGNIGMAQGARAPADGNTMTVVAPNIVANPALYPNAGYDPYVDFTAVTIAVRAPVVLCVNPSIPAATLDDLVAMVKAQPGRHAYASPGSGTPPHLVAEQLRMPLGLDLIHVPYSSAGQAVAAALGGHVPIVFSSTPPALQHIASGRLRALAVTGAARTRNLPNVPTMTEAGHGEVDGDGWFALVVPAATPKPVVDALYLAIAAAMNNADVRARMPVSGFEPLLMTPEASATRLRSEGEKLTRIIRSAGIKAD